MIIAYPRQSLYEERRTFEIEKAKFAVDLSAFEARQLQIEQDLNLLVDSESQIKTLREESAKQNQILEETRAQLDAERSSLSKAREQLTADQSLFEERESKLSFIAEDVLAKQKSVRSEVEALERSKEALESEKDALAKDRANILERESRLKARLENNTDLSKLQNLDQRERFLSEQEKSIKERIQSLADKESTFQKDFEQFEYQKFTMERKMAAMSEEARKAKVYQESLQTEAAATESLKDEYRLREEELNQSIKSFNTFKDQLEASMKQKEARLMESLSRLESERKGLTEKHSFEKLALENELAAQKELVEKLNRQLSQYQSTLSQQKEVTKRTKTEIDSKHLSLAEEQSLLDLEKSKLVELRSKTENDARFVTTEKDRILEEANQLEKEWVVLKLKEAEVAKALADISVAAAQQAVGSSITTAETIISRDHIRELEAQCRELSISNEALSARLGRETVGVW